MTKSAGNIPDLFEEDDGDEADRRRYRRVRQKRASARKQLTHIRVRYKFRS